MIVNMVVIILVKKQKSFTVPLEINLTDEITGMSSGTIYQTRDMFDKIVEATKKVEIPLSELPIATYDEKTRTFHYQEKGGAESE